MKNGGKKERKKKGRQSEKIAWSPRFPVFNRLHLFCRVPNSYIYFAVSAKKATTSESDGGECQRKLISAVEEDTACVKLSVSRSLGLCGHGNSWAHQSLRRDVFNAVKT